MDSIPGHALNGAIDSRYFCYATLEVFPILRHTEHNMPTLDNQASDFDRTIALRVETGVWYNACMKRVGLMEGCARASKNFHASRYLDLMMARLD